MNMVDARAFGKPFFMMGQVEALIALPERGPLRPSLDEDAA
jgi:hypothetical protein